MNQPDLSKERPQEYDANTIFRNRWSPRAMSGEEITEDELMKLFEAAKWAPSSFNSQPWRFIYAMKNSPEWQKFYDLLVDFNKSWAQNASALIIIASRKNFEYNEEYSKTHSFDTGAAWQNLALQASIQGLVSHGMGGFDHEEARKVANIPEGYEVEAMIAIGKPGERENLSKELQDAEQISERKKIKEIAFRVKMQ